MNSANSTKRSIQKTFIEFDKTKWGKYVLFVYFTWILMGRKTGKAADEVKDM